MSSWLTELKWKTKTAFLKSHKCCVVLFTDETRSCLRHIDGRRQVWRRVGEQHAVFNQLQPMVFGVSWCGVVYKPYQENTTCADCWQPDSATIC